MKLDKDDIEAIAEAVWDKFVKKLFWTFVLVGVRVALWRYLFSN